MMESEHRHSHHSLGSSSAGGICSNRLWPTPSSVENLDRKLYLGDGTTLSVGYATNDTLPVCYAMIQEAAKRGDNVGTDEFGSFDEVNESYFSMSETFQVLDSSTNQTKAFLLISPCIYSRGYYTCIASVRVIRTPNINDVTWARLVKLATQLVGVIDIGYTQCVVDVALCHSQLIRLLRDEAGFHITAIIPHCVNISGVGLYWNAILARHLDIPDKPIKSFQEIQERVEKLFPERETTEQYLAWSPRKLDFLPQVYTFRCGVQARIRSARKDEDSMLFEMMKDAMEKGEGFGTNEHPTLTEFRGKLLMKCVLCVIEEETTAKIIGYFLISPSRLKRSQAETALTAGCSVIISREFRRRKLMIEFTRLILGISKDLGYRHAVYNTVSGNIFRDCPGMSLVSTLPRAVYFAKGGWMDIVFLNIDICRDAQSFKEIVEENKTIVSNL